MTKVLVLGSGGILGTALSRALPGPSIDEAVLLARDACDVRDAAAFDRALSQHRPDVVINAAAYTKVDDCEDERELAFLVNGVAPGLLARRCRDAGIVLVHVSTDFVFDGSSSRPYTEEDPPRPLSVYGASKLLGEREVEREGGDWICVRTSWHYGDGGACFPRTIHQKALEGAPLRVVSDQRGRPTFSHNLAGAILVLLRAGARGLFHYADGGAVTWFELSQAIVATAGITPRSLEPIPSSELSRKARRPAYSVLATDKYERVTGCHPPPFSTGLATFLATLSRPAVAARS
ncbi:MAG: dTDP-4-dehydrorhamnose reductase [Acidobacteriota bacterium]